VLGEMRVCHGCLSYLPPLEMPEAEAVIDVPTYTQMKLSNGGQSNVVQLTDGSYLIIDGGKMYSTDRDNLLAFLYAHKPSHHPKPRVAAWLISHAHDDHMNLCMDFLQAHGKQIELQTFGYNFPDFESDIIQSDTEVAQKNRQKRIKRILDEQFPTTALWLMHSGQRLLLPGCEVSVLMTWEDFWPQPMKTVNQTSFCLDMRFEGGKKLMLPTDAWAQLCDQMATVYGDTLKSDVLQAIHHGLAGGSIPFYEKVRPEVVFWPQSPERVFSPEPIVVPDREKPIAVARQFAPNCWLLDRMERHYHHGETVTMDMKTLEVIS